VVDQRLRNRIVEALQVFAAGDEGVRAAGYVEFFELFFDYVDDDPQRGLPWRSNSALTSGEVEALNGILSVVLAAVDETSGLVGDDVLIRSGWPTRIMRTAGPALALMEGRGRFNEDAEEEEPSGTAFLDDMSDISKGRSRRSPHEKKQMSLARDGRNSYFANDKASRKSIPREGTREPSQPSRRHGRLVRCDRRDGRRACCRGGGGRRGSPPEGLAQVAR
jgi:hypothetical protein